MKDMKSKSGKMHKQTNTKFPKYVVGAVNGVTGGKAVNMTKSMKK